MTRDEIIHLAQKAGLIHYNDSEHHWSGVTNENMIEIEKNRNDDRLVEILAPFAALVAAAEREACAKCCDPIPGFSYEPAVRDFATKVAAAIRSRGKP